MPLQYITKPCPQCGNDFTTPLFNKHQICCSKQCSLQLRKRAKPDLFWRKVHKTSECWVWIAASNPNGYGVFGNQAAHRFSWVFHFGEIPRGLCVLHACDNRLCVRPDHLFLGTKKENTIDMLQKEREARGEMLPQAKLTAYDVRAIRTSHDSGDALAARYGVSKASISMIRHRKTWKHVK